MTEAQKQGIADLKIKAANGIVGGKSLQARLLEISPQAHESVQNGTCDDNA